MHSLRIAIQAAPDGARLLAMENAREIVLKARLRSNPAHPRALPTLLEGLALWQGQKVRAALCADESADSFVMKRYPDLFTDPGDTLLYVLDWVPVVRRRPVRREEIRGLGGFRELRELVLGEISR